MLTERWRGRGRSTANTKKMLVERKIQEHFLFDPHSLIDFNINYCYFFLFYFVFPALSFSFSLCLSRTHTNIQTGQPEYVYCPPSHSNPQAHAHSDSDRMQKPKVSNRGGGDVVVFNFSSEFGNKYVRHRCRMEHDCIQPNHFTWII